jgi:signal transduction histidine kinase
MMFPIVAAGLALAPRAAAAAMVALIAIGFLSAWLSDGRIDAMFLLQVTFGASAVAFRHLMATVAQLRRAREELARAAVTEERLRFARDLHDLLGRSLSVANSKCAAERVETYSRSCDSTQSTSRQTLYSTQRRQAEADVGHRARFETLSHPPAHRVTPRSVCDTAPDSAPASDTN